MSFRLIHLRFERGFTMLRRFPCFEWLWRSNNTVKNIQKRASFILFTEVYLLTHLNVCSHDSVFTSSKILALYGSQWSIHHGPTWFLRSPLYVIEWRPSTFHNSVSFSPNFWPAICQLSDISLLSLVEIYFSNEAVVKWYINEGPFGCEGKIQSISVIFVKLGVGN